MANSIEAILDKLQGVKASQTGNYKAFCPAHADKTQPSLSIKQEGNKILLKCFAGCDSQSIVKAMGIDMKDLFIDEPQTTKRPPVVKTYDYLDENRKLLFQVCRTDPKGFFQRYKNGTGEWHYDMKGVKRVIYHLPEVNICDGTIFHVEGEKDADNLMDRAIIATTSPGGANGWKDEYAEYYKGKKVIIIPDNDEPGYAYAMKVAQSLSGIASNIRAIIIPSPYKDVSDWLSADGDAEKLENMAKDISIIEDARNARNASSASDASLASSASDANSASLDTDANPKYGVVAKSVRNYLEMHKGDKFNLDTICRHLDLTDKTKREFATIELARQIKRGKVEKTSTSSGALYNVINNTITYINDWINAPVDEILTLKWPVSHADGSSFKFEETMIVPAGGLIVIAGVSNMGKTGFCQNFLVENCNFGQQKKFHCTMAINEANQSKFKRRISSMKWFDPLDTSGKVKFDLIERHEDWAYAIQPDDINIIDWINMPDGDFWKIDKVLGDIKNRLKKGIALVALQKAEGKTLGTGGQFSEHLADIYLLIDQGRLTVRKCKEWNAPDPNGNMWGFEIVEGGSQFSKIRRVKTCTECAGRCLQNHTSCENCHGTGYEDIAWT